ncbi:MAG: hypothetical protein Q9209_007531 [Squamulea sp. 1 TL-2023]
MSSWRVQDLEESLATLPEADRPKLHLRDEMLAGAATSQIAQAEVSQRLCIAIHSSGEIATADAAGLLSDPDAIRISYYRGLHARLAGSSSGLKGAMLAVGTDWEDAVTLSEDADAINHAKKVFDQEKNFARLLKMDTAYHGHHMLPFGNAYINSLQEYGVRVDSRRSNNSCSLFSNVTGSQKPVESHEELQDVYWRYNMTNAILFADAVKNAVEVTEGDQPMSLAPEAGPHPALQGPATQNISDMRSTALPYSVVLSRGINHVRTFSDTLGFI